MGPHDPGEGYQQLTTFRSGSSNVTGVGVIEVLKVKISNWVHCIWHHLNQGLTLLTASLVYHLNPRDCMSPALVNIDNWLRQELKKSQASFVDRHLILFGKGSVQPPKLQVNRLTAQLFQSYNSNSGNISMSCFCLRLELETPFNLD